MTPRKVDGNQADIVDKLRGIGATVADLHTVGGGCPDILVGYRGSLWLFEIKAPGQAKRLTKDERKFAESWQGQLAVIESLEDALRIMGVTCLA